jgi:hypothetical protein
MTNMLCDRACAGTVNCENISHCKNKHQSLTSAGYISLREVLWNVE